jgi:bacteriocin-like protein
MKEIMLKLGSVQNTLSKEEMKKISGGYLMCCCVGGIYGNLSWNHSWSTQPWKDGNCAATCSDPAYGGAWGGAWDSSSPCNYW